jgi:trehalose 6-phosphate phosphatase
MTMAAATQSSMQPLFGEEGMRRLDELVKPGVLCAFDFDGTLAPIVDKPDQASLSEEIRLRLIALSARTPVAVITGRAVADIKMRLGFEPTYTVGNHGLEGVPGWAQRTEDYRTICRSWLWQLEAVSREPGLAVEDKTYSLSVHYRLVPDPDETAAHLRAKLAELRPTPRIVEGKYVFNLLPMDGADKGRAIKQLIDVCAAHGAVYVGDDVTDEDVFRLERPDIVSIRIEYEAGSAAQFYVPEHGDIVKVLDLMVDKFDASLRRTSNKSHAAHNRI